MCERRREEAREGERRGRGKQRLGERRAALSDGRTNDDSASKCGAAAPIIREKLQLTHAYRSGRLS